MKTPQFINLQCAVSGAWHLVNATHITWINRFAISGYNVLFECGHSMVLHPRQYRRLMKRLNALHLT